jgi:rhamnosyltransferase
VISIVIPTKDGGDDLARCLDAISRQEIANEVEIIVVDSGSSDGSARRAHSFGAVVREIPASEFSHGGARNLGAETAGGDILVFTTQDAYAADDRWLTHLIEPLRSAESVAGVYGRQLPHDDARPPERYFLDFLYGSKSRIQRLSDPAGLTYEATLFSNVNSAIRRSVWLKYPFADDVLMSEDQEWSRRVLLDGLTVVYEPRAVVRHSHAYTIGSAFRRFFDSGASADRAYLSDNRASRSAIGYAARRYAVGEVAWLWRSGQRRWLPYAAVYELAKFAGLQLGARHSRLPLWLKRRVSGLPAYWDREPA